MYRISKSFEFSASHILHGLPEGHQCGRLHGHNYSVEVELESHDTDDTGFVLDYGALRPFKDWLDNCVDHRHLNDVFDFQPSAELMARDFLGTVERILRDAPRESPWRVSAVRVHETPKTCAEYRP